MSTIKIEPFIWLNLEHDILKIENCVFNDKLILYSTTARVLSLFKFMTASTDLLSQKQTLALL